MEVGDQISGPGRLIPWKKTMLIIPCEVGETADSDFLVKR